MLIAKPHGVRTCEARQFDYTRLDKIELEDGGAPSGTGLLKDAAGTEFHDNVYEEAS
jgi:hypothetical protein